MQYIFKARNSCCVQEIFILNVFSRPLRSQPCKAFLYGGGVGKRCQGSNLTEDCQMFNSLTPLKGFSILLFVSTLGFIYCFCIPITFNNPFKPILKVYYKYNVKNFIQNWSFGFLKVLGVQYKLSTSFAQLLKSPHTHT